MQKADLHIHSNCSDGSDSSTKLPEIVKKANIDVFALTDHDTVEGCLELSKTFDKFIRGVELTCLCGKIKCHILGYGIDIYNEDKKEYGPFKINRNEKIILNVKTNSSGYFASEVKVICK